MLDPEDFASLGTLAWSSGNYTIDTDALTIVDDTAPGTPLFSGVVDDQNGAADSFGGSPGPLGIPEIAVFTFASIAIDGTANVTIVGTRALALLSHGDALINRVLAVDGKGVWVATSTTFLAGGPGGFGGGINAQGGLGPGGGPGWAANKSSVCSSGGGFGSAGVAGNQIGVVCLSAGYGSPTTSSPYGDLQGVLQGGSGGGSADNTNVPGVAAGAGGGGAIEIGAVGSLTVGASGTVRANGGEGQARFFSVYEERSAGGSGGAIRLAASSLAILGNVQARGGRVGWSAIRDSGGGGRVLLRGLLGLFVAGTTTPPSAFTTGIDVSSLGVAGASPFPGRPMAGSAWSRLYFVEAGDSIIITPFVLQTPSDLQPGVELVSRNVIAQGNLIVPSVGHIHEGRIQLDRSTSSITGTGTLTLEGPLTGTGNVAVPVVNTPLGGIFGLRERAGLRRHRHQPGRRRRHRGGWAGELPGRRHSQRRRAREPGDAQPDRRLRRRRRAHAGGLDRERRGRCHLQRLRLRRRRVLGHDEPGHLQRRLFPGDSPAAIDFGGDLAFGAANVLEIELGGTAPGTQHDRLNVAGSLATGGALVLTPLAGSRPRSARASHCSPTARAAASSLS